MALDNVGSLSLSKEPGSTEGRAPEFQRALAAFRDYIAAADILNDAMAAVGVPTRNVDPLANFAEVVVACELQGKVQRATNKGFDVRTADGAKIQVKSLRVSSTKPEDNPINWLCSTRQKGLANGPLIDADWLAVVVYLDSRLHTLVLFRLVPVERFPVVNVKDLYFRHVERLVKDRKALDGQVVRIIDLKGWGAT